MNKTGFLFTLALMAFTSGHAQSGETVDPWRNINQIESSIKAPTFPDKNFDILAYGAVGNGKTSSTTAFANAIEACHAAGGGHVIVPKGKFLTGPIHLKSNVDLHLSKDSEILFSQDTKQYLPAVLTRFEGVELMNYSPFIYAFEQENIAITGEGEINGQCDAQHWWFWKGKWEDSERMGVRWTEGMPSQKEANDRLKAMAANNTPVSQRIFGEGDYLRPNFIQPYRCKNILIEGITIKNSPMWIIHPVLSENIIIRKVTVISHGPNNDGCDPESSKNILVEDCFFDTGDDCIAIKSGRDHDGRRLHTASENIIIRNCTMKDGHGGVVIGSEISGDVRNVYAENCEMSSPDLDRVIRIKSNSYRGGAVENVFVRNIKVGVVSDAIVVFEMFYSNEKGNYPPSVKNVQIKNVSSKKSKYGIKIGTDEKYQMENILIEDCEFDEVAKGNLIEGTKNVVLKNVKINGKNEIIASLFSVMPSP